jgi:pimeloyl-ACP methyl ester carboxylesterase
MNAPRPEPRLNFVQCLGTRGLHRMAYWEWGDPANDRVLVCVHGLSRQGRDFDTLAQALCQHYRVVCPDVVGRGRSDWLADPMGYAIPQYVADMVTLLARVNARSVDWVGTSMGGLIGIGLASLDASPLRRVVLNDVGPTIEMTLIDRIRSYVGQAPRWASLDDAAEALRLISQGFGPHTPLQWRALTEPQLKPEGDGFTLRSDPAIAVPIHAATAEAFKAGEALMWAAYDRVKPPVLLLRGEHSDALSRATAEAMGQRGPRAQLAEVAGVGHAPTLVQPDQVQLVREFLQSP